jgi:diacylglycerol kinase (ATP)
MLERKLRRKVMFVVNGTAGSGNHAGIDRLISRLAAQYDVECSIVQTQAPGHATQLAQTARETGHAAVVAVGGDGTVNEVAQALVDTPVTMGIVPRGSGNGLARHLGISLNSPQAVDQIFSGKELAIDTFTVNDRLSVNVSGIGFDGHIADLFGGKGKRGFVGYIRLAITEFNKFMPFNCSIEVDNQKLSREAFIVAIANSSQYGNNARIAPMASVMDGRLHMNIVKKVPPYRLDFLYDCFWARSTALRFARYLNFKLRCKSKPGIRYPFISMGKRPAWIVLLRSG